MKLNPFEIGKVVSKAIRNKDHYKARFEEIKASPLKGRAGSAVAIYDIEKNRIARIEAPDVPADILDQIKDAVNDAFDQADRVWAECE